MQAKEIKIEYCSTQYMVVNIFTKVLLRGKHEDFIRLMGVTSNLELELDDCDTWFLVHHVSNIVTNKVEIFNYQNIVRWMP